MNIKSYWCIVAPQEYRWKINYEKYKHVAGDNKWSIYNKWIINV